MNGSFHPYPKPKDAKKRKKVNGWKDKPVRRCYYCGTPGAERHEVYGGANRQISIDNGFQLDLCPSCHRAWHAQGDPVWIERKRRWQTHFQMDWEDRVIRGGIKPEQARELWIEMIGKSYIDA